MPRQLHLSRVPVDLSIVEFNLDAGEDIFLTYTWERWRGPGIVRTGKGPPFMNRIGGKPGETTTNPFGLRLGTWLIQEDLRYAALVAAIKALAEHKGTSEDEAVLRDTVEELLPDEFYGARALLVRLEERDLDKNLSDEESRFLSSLCDKDLYIVKRLVDELEKGHKSKVEQIKAHDMVFRDRCDYRKIIGQQGCGDLTMNLWNVAYVNNCLGQRPPELVHLHDEPTAYRTYPCLVKWKAREASIRRLTIEEVRFNPDPGSDPNRMVWVRYGDESLPRGRAIEFAVSSQQVIREGQLVPVHTINSQFSDFRHLIQMPNLNPDGPLYPGERLRPSTGYRPREYFAKDQYGDIWFGEADLLTDENLQRAALSCPVFLGFPPGANERRLQGAMLLAGYSEASSALKPLARGEWRFVQRGPQTQVVEVHFRRNTYGWTMLGLSADNRRILCLACTGRPGASGYTLEEAARQLLQAGVHNALLIDEGGDVFQKVCWENGTLQDMVPRMRRRLRATFIFARPGNERKLTEGGCHNESA